MDSTASMLRNWLRQKEQELQRLENQVQALRTVIEMMEEDAARGVPVGLEDQNSKTAPARGTGQFP